MHHTPTITTTGPRGTTARADLDLLMAAPRDEAPPILLVADHEDRELAIIERAILAGLVTP